MVQPSGLENELCHCQVIVLAIGEVKLDQMQKRSMWITYKRKLASQEMERQYGLAESMMSVVAPMQ